MQGQDAKDVSGQPKGIDNLLYSADAGKLNLTPIKTFQDNSKLVEAKLFEAYSLRTPTDQQMEKALGPLLIVWR